MDKQELRRLFLQKRGDLKVEEHELLSTKIKDQFISFLPEHVKTVHIYLPIPSKGEINTWPIIHELWSRKIQVVVPTIDSRVNNLQSILLTPETQLNVNSWGVPEPVTGREVANEAIDALVVPLLAIDIHGHRVGFGKGFYDKYLNSIHHKPVKIGLSFFPPVEEISALDSWDIPLEFCVTPDQVITF